MHDEQEAVRVGSRRLPPGALAGLRQAYARALAERVPRLQLAVAGGQEPLLRAAVRDALGEHLAAWRP